jgi:hypothetical protein
VVAPAGQLPGPSRGRRSKAIMLEVSRVARDEDFMRQSRRYGNLLGRNKLKSAVRSSGVRRLLAERGIHPAGTSLPSNAFGFIPRAHRTGVPAAEVRGPIAGRPAIVGGARDSSRRNIPSVQRVWFHRTGSLFRRRKSTPGNLNRVQSHPASTYPPIPIAFGSGRIVAASR